MTAKNLHHYSVLWREIIEYSQLENHKLILDCTFGGGGHSRNFLIKNTESRVFAIDCDPQAVNRMTSLKENFPERFTGFDLNFSSLDATGLKNMDLVFMDLGVSSYQLDQVELGFSFRENAPIDMRLDPRKGIPASEFLETASEEKLVEAIRNYGEEKSWRAVVRAILRVRGSGILQKTQPFVELVEKALPKRPYRLQKIHPVTKVFQGIRIAVNQELVSLEKALPKAFAALSIGGSLMVISFHSLEDRILKRFMRRMAGKTENRFDQRTLEERSLCAEMVNKKPILPTAQEIQENRRSRSAKLRILKKIRHYYETQ